jgi:hypothetical protein
MNTRQWTLWGVTAALATSLLAPISASAQSNRQKTKNNWRNAAVGSAALAGYGLLKHKKAATIVGIAGAAYSANRYEQDRKHQAEQSRRASARREARSHGGNYVRNGKKYYKFDGRMYVMDMNTGARHPLG